MQTLLPVS